MYKDLINNLLNRQVVTNKYDYGHVLIVGGAPGMVGAPLLSAMAAFRIGAGLVTIASTSNVIDKLEKRVLEIMTLRIPDDKEKSIETLTDFIINRKVSVIVFGPGMNPDFGEIVLNMMDNLTIPVILDAGAITCYKKNIELLKKQAIKNTQIIMTPHDGEFEKLTEIKLPTQLNERKKIVADFSQNYKLVLVSKGNPTLVSHMNSDIYENKSGNPGLATAGTGDVLTGVIAGLVAQKLLCSEACELGVYIHGLAGDIASREKTQAAMVASDVIEYLPNALKESK